MFGKINGKNTLCESKAFDTVPHDKLLQELDNYGVRGNLLKWLGVIL